MHAQLRAYAPLTIIQQVLTGFGVESHSEWVTCERKAEQYEVQVGLNFRTDKGRFVLTWNEEERLINVRVQKAENGQFVETPISIADLNPELTYSGLVLFITGINPAPKRTYPFGPELLRRKDTAPIFAASWRLQ